MIDTETVKQGGAAADEGSESAGQGGDLDAGAETIDEATADYDREDQSVSRWGAAIVMAIVVALAALTGWLAVRTHDSYGAHVQREQFLQVARQGAINLTTIDAAHADQDVQRILDSATGTFYDDFSQRSRPFVEVVEQVESKSEGTVTEAALESVTGDQAQALVAVSVKTSTAEAPQQDPRAWRMRITVQRVGDQAKVSNVEFVP